MTKSLLLMLLLMLPVWTSSSVVFSSQTTTFDEERFNNVVAKMESTGRELGTLKFILDRTDASIL
jgi:hypothetical protein